MDAQEMEEALTADVSLKFQVFCLQPCFRCGILRFKIAKTSIFLYKSSPIMFELLRMM